MWAHSRDFHFFILLLWGYGMSPNIKKINRWNHPEPIHTGHFSPGHPFATFSEAYESILPQDMPPMGN